MTDTRWNGEACSARRITAIVADNDFFPGYWARHLVGTRRNIVEVTYGGSTFYLDDEAGEGWHKVTHGGSPRWAHSNITIDSNSIQPRGDNPTDPDQPSLQDQLDGAYRERAHLVAWLAALHPAVIAPAPDVDEPGWQILYLTSSAYGWQMTWHIHPRDAELFKDVEHVPADDPRAQWDGHSTEQKYNRMRTHVRVVHMNNRLGATSCPVCEGSGRCPACHTTMRAVETEEQP